MVNNYKQDEAKTKFSWKSIRRMMDFVKPYKKELIINILIGVLSSILLLFIPKIVQYAIDVAFPKKDFWGIVLLTCLMLILVILAVMITKIKRDKLILVLDNISNDLKITIFQKLQYLPTTYYDTKSHGKIYTRAANYPDDVSYIMCYVLLGTILDIINLVFVIVFMLTINVKLSLISILLMIFLVGVFLFLGPIRRKFQEILNNKNSNINAYISESINGVRITQSFNREAKNESILKSLEKERIKAARNTLLIGNLSWALTGMFNYISMAIIYYIGLRFMYPIVSIGEILAIDSYSSRFWEPIEYLTSSYSDFMDASTYLERIFEVLDEPLVISDSSNARNVDIRGDVTFKDVVFGYQKEKKVLDHVNLSIKAGEKVGLVGETGCGKSTILNLISRFYDVDQGEILIDGVNVKDIKLECLRSNVSMMLQDNFLFARSVYDNLVLDKKKSKAEVIEVAKMLDIHDMIMSMPNGYETILLNNGSNLSNGERQLLCMARIMIQNPKILILDEATSNVDIKTEKKIKEAVDIITRNRTTIMVAHRMATIKNCDKIVLIREHKNYEEGTHKELIKKKGEYYKLYNSQSV